MAGFVEHYACRGIR